MALELARLGYEVLELRGQDIDIQTRKSSALEKSQSTEKGELELRMDKVENEGLKAKWGKWYREVGVNAAYAPMTIHYSLENGVLGDGAIAALGVVVGALSIGQAWKMTA